jgi:hypothetical protein
MGRLQDTVKKPLELFRKRPRGTVRATFSLTALALFLTAALTNSEVSYIRLTASNSLVEEGDRFSVDVFAYAHVPVNAVDVTLRFDGDTVEVVSVDRGQSVLTIWTEDPIIEANKITLRGGTFRKGFLGEHRLATVELRAKKTGKSNFSADSVILLAGDGRGTPVTVAKSSESSASLYIYDESQTPSDIAVDVQISIVTDIDGDGTVGFNDLSAFMSAWVSKQTAYDFNGDGKMSFRDFSIILSDYFLGG